ncbi:MFS transporter [Neomoorella thermoacetica]|uniref:Inner membrane transport protein YnfM n=2 Tax=Neomoorella thermoacetica TaxID=1525 RepID=A0A1J5K501_NEOTH|nr:MFS transporter [Moorella thermoacetica]OIQ09179.1 inner membrane transport protein YnfM [Moorella thermoacetica]OIQ10785.1 inner membrane transport protein YnfM [Moorella thermoacetica]GAF25435.1 permeases of the major facilitator superfamily [Moorella thermoacetica Y72]
MKRNTLILILGLAGFTVMADNWVVSPILPAIARSLNIEPIRAGLLITAYMIPFGLFQLIFGPLADRYGKRQVVNLAMALFTLGTGLSALGFSLTGLAAYRALTGIFAASVMPISLALIGDVVPLQERQAAIGTFMGISFLGQGLSMAIGGTIAYFLSWRGVFAAYAILALVSTLLLYTLGSRIPSVRNPRSQFFTPYLRLLSSATSAPVYLVVLLEGILIIGSFSYLGAYIAQTYHYNNFVIGLIMTAFGIAAVLAGRASGPLAARWSRRPVLLAGLLAATGADVLFWTYGSQLSMLILGVALLGLGFMLAHSTLLTIATEFAARARGTAMSLVAFAFMGGGGVGTAIGGRLIHAFNFNRFFAFYALCLLLLIILAALVVRVDTAAPTRLEPAGDTR